MNLTKRISYLYEIGGLLEQRIANGNYKDMDEREKLIIELKESTNELERLLKIKW